MTKSSPERVGFSARRVGIIAWNTFTETVRQKVFNVLLLFALVVIASASFFAQFSFGEQLKFVKDFCLGALSVFGSLIAIVGTAQMLPNELENRTLYTLLAKPVRRVEFLLGKYVGIVVLVLLSVALMSVLCAAVLGFKEQRLVAEALQQPEAQELIRTIRQEALDPDLVKGIVLIGVKLMLVAAMTLLFSTFSTSMVFNVTVAFLAFLAGHLRGGVSEVLAGHTLWKAALAVVPDLSLFNVADDIILGNAIPWSHVASVALYGILRTMVIVAAAHLIFSRKEI